jgi:hypothetical protein
MHTTAFYVEALERLQLPLTVQAAWLGAEGWAQWCEGCAAAACLDFNASTGRERPAVHSQYDAEALLAGAKLEKPDGDQIGMRWGSVRGLGFPPGLPLPLPSALPSTGALEFHEGGGCPFLMCQNRPEAVSGPVCEEVREGPGATFSSTCPIFAGEKGIDSSKITRK